MGRGDDLLARLGRCLVNGDQSTTSRAVSQVTHSIELRVKFRAAFLAVAPAMFLGSLDQTIVAAALPVMARSFGGLDRVTWTVTGYLLAATVAAPIYGRLGDAFGRRRMLLWSLLLFLIGSLACAVAPSLMALIVGRCVQGFGGGGLMTLAQALLGEVVLPKERGRFQGWFGAVFALASTIGPSAGGFLTQYVGWRAIFWINIPLSIVAAMAILRFRAADGTGRYRTDYPGVSIFTLGTVCLMLALTLGGHELGWKSVSITGLLILSVSSFVLLCVIEHHSQDPLLPPRVVANPVIGRATLTVLLFASVLFGFIIQLPLFLQAEFGVSTNISGLLLIPLTVAQVAVSTATGLRISSTGRPRNAMLFGLSVVTVSSWILIATLHRGPILVTLLTLLIGAGLGSTMPAAQTTVQWAAGDRDIGEATAVLSFSRSVGGVIGVSITSAVLMASQSHAVAASSTVQTSGFQWMFFSLGVLALLAAITAATLPNVDRQAAELRVVAAF